MHLPGSGITPFTVDELPLVWWRVYRARAKEVADELTKQAKEARRGK